MRRGLDSVFMRDGHYFLLREVLYVNAAFQPIQNFP